MKLNNKEITLEQMEMILKTIEELTAKHAYKPEIEILEVTHQEHIIHGCEALTIETNRGTYYCCYPNFNNYEFYIGVQSVH